MTGWEFPVDPTGGAPRRIASSMKPSQRSLFLKSSLWGFATLVAGSNDIALSLVRRRRA